MILRRVMAVAARASLATVLALWLAAPGHASDFSFIRVKGSSTTLEQPYGAVVMVTPFTDPREGSVPLWLLVDSGDFASPWQRAKHVAGLLSKVVELILYRREVVKVGLDEDSNPSLYVGPPTRPICKADLKVVSILQGDVDRFGREIGETRKLDRMSVALYWKALLEDLTTIFVRYPLARDRNVLSQMKLAGTKSGSVLKRVLIETGVLLRYDNLTEENASPEDVLSRQRQVLQGLSREQWAQLTGLAFRIPSDVRIQVTPAGRPGVAHPGRPSVFRPGR